jgi:hypothetical protein
VDLAMTDETAPDECTALLTALSALGGAALEPRPVALGNVEVSAAASMLWSGIVLRFLGGPSAEKGQIPGGTLSWTSVDPSVVAVILRDEFGVEEAGSGEGVDQMLLNAVHAKGAASGPPAGVQSSPLSALAAVFSHGDAPRGFATRIEQPDLATFAWDVLLAARLHALCRLARWSRATPGSSASGLAGAVAFCTEHYSELERRLVLGQPTDETGTHRAVLEAQQELRAHIKERGLGILAMLRNRLGRTP